MADVQATVDIISALKIRQLDSEWVSEVWNNAFTEVQPLPEDVAEDINDTNQLLQTLRRVLCVLTPWAEGKDGPTGQGFWTVMMENELSHRSLIALLYHIIEASQKRLASATEKEAGIVADAIYFSIIKIPGSGAFHVFHPMLFQKAVDTFKLLTSLDADCPKRKRTSTQQSSQGRSRPKRRGRSAACQDDSPFGDSDEDEEDDGEEMSRQEVAKLYADTFELLKSFVQLLGECHLKESSDTAVHCIQALVRLTRLEADTFDGCFSDTRHVAEMRTVPEVAFKGLSMLCRPSHGDVGTMYTAMCKNLLPSLLMLIGDNKGVAAQTIPRPILQIKGHAVAYIIHLLQTDCEGCLHSVRILLQHLCVKVPDKADYRSKVAEVFIDILNEHSTAAYASIAQWLHRYSRNAKMSYRVFALDIVALLLNQPERHPNDEVLPEHVQFLPHRFLIQTIVARCSDVAATVRSRAITAFVQCVSSDQPIIINAIKDIVTPHPVVRTGNIPRLVPTPGAQVGVDGDVRRLQSDSSERDDTSIEPETRRSTNPASPLALVPMETPGPNTHILLPDSSGVVSMLRRRVCDEKVNVRKAAVQALESIILLDAANFYEQDLDAIYQRCLDPALSVRKQALVSLTALLQKMTHNVKLQGIWLEGVLPMVMDREMGAQEKCLSVLEDVLLANIVSAGRNEETDACQLTWSLLDVIAGSGGADMRRYLRKAFQLWKRADKLKPKLINALQSHIDSNHNKSAWMMLAEMAPFVSTFNTRLILDYWHEHAEAGTEGDYETNHRVLSVLGHIAKNIDKSTLLQLADTLKKRLMKFDAPPELIVVTILTLNKACRAHTDENVVSKRVRDEWFGELLRECDAYLSEAILCENPVAPLDEEQVVRHLFTLGEIAQLCPERTPKRAFMLVQSLIAAPTITGGATDGASQSSESSQSSQCVLSQGVLSQFKGSQMSGKIRAHAFLALGKLCLQNEDLAKKCVPAMARELETSTDLCVRNNVLVILCDLCVRYTLVVDSYVPNIAACLKDESALVRKHCLTVLTRLLQEDFLKWKGSLFFRFITALVDESKDIKHFADFCLVHLLKQRHPAMFFQHFIECIFHFNSYSGHSVYNQFTQTEREKNLFSLKGESNRGKRLHIYKVLLENMTDEQKFHLTGKLCSEVLAAVVDEVIPLDADTSTILQDALSILSLKEIRLTAMQTKAHDEDIVDERDMAAAVLNAAKKTVISKVLKVNLIENIVPTVMSLKHILESRHSPVLKDLMLYLRDLMKENKTEIKDILVANKQLAAEIEFDLRKFEEEQKRQEHLRAVGRRSSSAVNSPMGSPRAPVPATPARGKTPQQGSAVRGPTNKPSTPVMARVVANGTPARKTPMSTVAIMNSARKAIEKARRLSTVQAGQCPDSGPRRVVSWETENTPPPQNIQTPKKRGKTQSIRRAISTPAHVAMANITFQQGDQNMSVIPPSPIPSSLSIRLYSQDGSGNMEATTSENATLDDDDDDVHDRTPVDIICMLSPDRPTPKPRAWNIKSTKTLDKSGSSKKADKSTTLGTRRSGRLQSQTTEQEGI